MMQQGVSRWEVLYELMKENGYRRIAEVGCKEGRTTEYLLSAFPDSVVIAIDPWENIPNEAESYDEWDFEAIKAEFYRRTDEYKDRRVVLPVTSVEAAEEMKSGSLDMVFIDAAHDYENVRNDIEAWYPKVRQGGLIAGHDWQHKFPDVQRAVTSQFNALHVQVFSDSVWAVRK